MRQHVITTQNITVVFDAGEPVVLPRSSPNAGELIRLLSLPRATDAAVREAASVPRHLTKYGKNRLDFNGNEVLLDGNTLPTVLGNTVKACYENGAPFNHFLRFWKRLNSNVRPEATQELQDFLKHRAMPITPKGHFLGYKGVNEDYWSVFGNKSTRVLRGKTDERGRILNSIGSVIEVDRADVNPDRNQTCSVGLHVGSHEYAKGHGPHTLIVSVDPADVVSIPSDCAGQKLRTCRYKVVSDYVTKMDEAPVKSQERPYDVFVAPGVHHDDTQVAVVCI